MDSRDVGMIENDKQNRKGSDRLNVGPELSGVITHMEIARANPARLDIGGAHSRSPEAIVPGSSVFGT
jgi:hypothetical protein